MYMKCNISTSSFSKWVGGKQMPLMFYKRILQHNVSWTVVCNLNSVTQYECITRGERKGGQ